MLYVDVPTVPEIRSLTSRRADACVSIYLRTTPLSQEAEAGGIELRNLARQAREQLEAVGFDKRRLASLMAIFDDLANDGEFWRFQANSLAVLATADGAMTFRLANRLTPTVQVSDRFHLKPLLRAATSPHTAFVLALSENAARLVEISADLPPSAIKVDALPKDAASAVGKSTLNDRSHVGRIVGTEGQNVRLMQYARKVDAALRPILAGRETPLIIAAPGRLAGIYRSVNTYPRLLQDGIDDSPDQMTEAELAKRARPILDADHARMIGDIRALFETRANQGRATGDISDAARAATYGAIEALLVDIDADIPGTIDDENGKVTFAKEAGAESYSIVDEIAARAMAAGARVIGVRKDEIPGGGHLAASLRCPV